MDPASSPDGSRPGLPPSEPTSLGGDDEAEVQGPGAESPRVNLCGLDGGNKAAGSLQPAAALATAWFAFIWLICQTILAYFIAYIYLVHPRSTCWNISVPPAAIPEGLDGCLCQYWF